MDSTPGSEDPLEEEMATCSSILAWRIPWTEEPGGLQSLGSQRVRHDWAAKDTHTVFRLDIDHFNPVRDWAHSELDFGSKKGLSISCSFFFQRCSPLESNWNSGTSTKVSPLFCCCCSVTRSCLTLCDPMDCSMPVSSVLHHLPEFAQTHVHCVGDAIKPSHPLLPPSSPALSLCQHQSCQWVSSSHQAARVLEPQLQHQSFQWTVRIDFL